MKGDRQSLPSSPQDVAVRNMVVANTTNDRASFNAEGEAADIIMKMDVGAAENDQNNNNG